MVIIFLKKLISYLNFKNCLGTFVNYNNLLDPKAPERNGFAGGSLPVSNFDIPSEFLNGVSSNSTITTYVGAGVYSSRLCAEESPAPGAIITSIKPSALMLCQNNTIPDEHYAHYLLKNKSLTWVQANFTTIKNLTAPVTVPKNPNFLIARINYQGNNYLGKLNNDTNTFYINTSSGQVHFTSGFEVLTCKPCKSKYSLI